MELWSIPAERGPLILRRMPVRIAARQEKQIGDRGASIP